jgi:hypothetical protein
MNALKIIAILVVSVSIQACGLRMQNHYVKMRPHLVSGNYDAANEYLDLTKKSFYKSEKNRLLFFMDKAMVLHGAGRFKESNAYIEQAKIAAQELWTESVRENIGALLTTDNALSYSGEDFERVLIHFVGALNHIGLGDYGAARVEARQITNKLELYNQSHKGKRSAYKDDAFARWLAGKLAETEGGIQSLNDAWIDYKKAIKVYKTDYLQRYGTAAPRLLMADALRVLNGLGADFNEEFDALRKANPNARFVMQSEKRKLGELVFIHLNGEAPFKRDMFWTAQADGDIIRVAYPQFIRKPRTIVSARVHLEGTKVSTKTELVEDITAIAVENLNDHMARIKAKAIARSIAKYIASKGIQAAGKKVGGDGGSILQVAGVLMNWGSAIAEEADKRSWITLPAAVNVGELYAKPGKYKAVIEYLDGRGQVVQTHSKEVVLKPGKTAFISHRTYY